MAENEYTQLRNWISQNYPGDQLRTYATQNGLYRQGMTNDQLLDAVTTALFESGYRAGLENQGLVSPYQGSPAPSTRPRRRRHVEPRAPGTWYKKRGDGYVQVPSSPLDCPPGTYYRSAARRRGGVRVNAFGQEIPFSGSVTPPVCAELPHRSAWQEEISRFARENQISAIDAAKYLSAIRRGEQPPQIVRHATHVRTHRQAPLAPPVQNYAPSPAYGYQAPRYQAPQPRYTAPQPRPSYPAPSPAPSPYATAQIPPYRSPAPSIQTTRQPTGMRTRSI